MKRGHRENEVGPWAKQKLDALESYLKAYMTIMEKRNFRLFYVDAFAGSGIARVRSSGTEVGALLSEEDVADVELYIQGSPLRALSLKPGFEVVRFFDLDRSRIEMLNELGSKFPDINLKAEVGDANEKVQFIAENFDRPNFRGFAFLDPYGHHLHWATVEKLARTEKFDVLINIPIHMAIDRLIRRDGAIPDTHSRDLDAFFGSKEWKAESYSTVPSLFGESVRKNEDTARRLLALYMKQLRSVFPHVTQPSLVRNTKNSPLYYLVLASHKKAALSIADHILGLGERVRVPK